MEKAIIKVDGMSCGHCSSSVKYLIEELEGVESAEIRLADGEAVVSYDKATVDTQKIIDNINNSEVYKATLK